MKKLIVLVLALVVGITTLCLVNHKEEDYLRIHISNSSYDLVGNFSSHILTVDE